MSIRNYHKFMGYENPNNQAPIVPIVKPSIAAGETKPPAVDDHVEQPPEPFELS